MRGLERLLHGVKVVFELIYDSLSGIDFCWDLTEVNKYINVNISEAALIAIPALIVALLIPVYVYYLEDSKNDYRIHRRVMLKDVLLYRILLVTLLFESVFLVVDIRLFSLMGDMLLLQESSIVFYRIVRLERSYEEWQTY